MTTNGGIFFECDVCGKKTTNTTYKGLFKFCDFCKERYRVVYLPGKFNLAIEPKPGTIETHWLEEAIRDLYGKRK